jgi:preprotein translocase subunit YajC
VIPLQAAENASGAGLSGLLLPLLLVAAFWFIAIRPARRRQAQQRAVISALSLGDRVITTSGLHGTITGMDDATVLLEIAPGVVVTWARPAVLEVVSGS